MSSEVKLMLQSDIDVNPNSSNFKLNFGDKNKQGKKNCFYQKTMSLSLIRLRSI